MTASKMRSLRLTSGMRQFKDLVKQMKQVAPYRCDIFIFEIILPETVSILIEKGYQVHQLRGGTLPQFKVSW